MPSAIAHAVVGASIASLGATRRPFIFGLITLAILAASPDLDVIGFRLGIPYEHPLGHRGASHSLAFAATIAVLSAPLWRYVFRFTEGRWALWSVLTFLAVASHGVLDALTDAGLGVGFFIPFDNTRYFFPWRPLATSPLSIRAFFSERGLSILTNETMWIGPPIVLMLALAFAVRKLRRP